MYIKFNNIYELLFYTDVSSFIHREKLCIIDPKKASTLVKDKINRAFHIRPDLVNVHAIDYRLLTITTNDLLNIVIYLGCSVYRNKLLSGIERNWFEEIAKVTNNSDIVAYINKRAKFVINIEHKQFRALYDFFYKNASASHSHNKPKASVCISDIKYAGLTIYKSALSKVDHDFIKRFTCRFSNNDCLLFQKADHDLISYDNAHQAIKRAIREICPKWLSLYR